MSVYDANFLVAKSCTVKAHGFTYGRGLVAAIPRSDWASPDFQEFDPQALERVFISTRGGALHPALLLKGVLKGFLTFHLRGWFWPNTLKVDQTRTWGWFFVTKMPGCFFFVNTKLPLQKLGGKDSLMSGYVAACIVHKLWFHLRCPYLAGQSPDYWWYLGGWVAQGGKFAWQTWHLAVASYDNLGRFSIQKNRPH